MSEFDPYHKWFGIRAEQQPADHYRLLGIDAFESDPDIIESAAEQRMTYLQVVANGPHVEVAQRLLNEVSSARVVLLNDERRSKYDARLRSQLNRVEGPKFEPVNVQARLLSLKT